MGVRYKRLPLGPACSTAPKSYAEGEQVKLDDYPSLDNKEGEDRGEEAATAFPPLPQFPGCGWTSQGAPECGQAAVAEWGRWGADYYAKGDINGNAEDKRLEKIGKVMMEVKWASHTAPNVSVGLDEQSGDEFLRINNLLEEAMKSLDNNSNDLPAWSADARLPEADHSECCKGTAMDIAENCPSLQMMR